MTKADFAEQHRKWIARPDVQAALAEIRARQAPILARIMANAAQANHLGDHGTIGTGLDGATDRANPDSASAVDHGQSLECDRHSLDQ